MRQAALPTTRRCAAWYVAVIALSVGLLPPVAGLAKDEVWEQTPYRILVLTSLSPSPEFTAAGVHDLTAGLIERVDVCVGAPWIVTTRPITAGEMAVLRLPQRILNEIWTPPPKEKRRRTKAAPGKAKAAEPAAPPRPVHDPALVAEVASLLKLAEGTGGLDKILLLEGSVASGTFQFAIRELDLRTRLYGAGARISVPQRLLAAAEVFRLVLRTVAPLGIVETIEQENYEVEVDGQKTSKIRSVAKVRLRAAGIPFRDPSITTTAPGSVFRLAVRGNERDGTAKSVQVTQWTYLTVQAVANGEAACRLYTGLGAPPSGKKKGREERLALGIGPIADSTLLELRSRSELNRPLGGYEVYAHPPEDKETLLLGLTRRDGSLEIPPAAAGVRILLIKNGGEVLARLPIVPGLEESLVAAVPDDDQRLEVEGYITGFQERFVDVVAMRSVLITRFRSRLEAGKFDEAKALLEQMRIEGNADQFQREVASRQQGIASSDEQIQFKITKMFEDTQKVITKFMDPRELDNLETELARAREAPSPVPATAGGPVAGGAAAVAAPAATNPPTAAAPATSGAAPAAPPVTGPAATDPPVNSGTTKSARGG